MNCKKIKRMISVLLCTILIFTLGFTAMAQTNEEKAHYMTDYKNLGELFADLESEEFAKLDDDVKEELYNTSIEEVLEQEENSDKEEANTRATTTFTATLTTTALLKGRLTYKPAATATVQANSITISGVVYDASGKVVDTKAQTEYNVYSSNFSRQLTGLTSDEQHKVYVKYTASFPAGSITSSAVETKTAYVNVK